MEVTKAQRVIESLRYGIPPNEYVLDLTVGRKDEINSLCDMLNDCKPSSLLINANYGVGKTHLLHLIREEALRKGWIVSLVTMDFNSRVRLDLLSQIVGSICRNLEVPEKEGKGIRFLLDVFKDHVINQTIDHDFWITLHNDEKWDKKRKFNTEPFFLGIRTWLHTDSYLLQDYIVNWFQFPQNNFVGTPSNVFNSFVKGMRKYFLDARPKGYFTRERLNFTHNDDLCWAFLKDIIIAARSIGFKGLILCFDEFDEIISAINRTSDMIMSFYNLFELFHAFHDHAQVYFSVTPLFVEKCKQELTRRSIYDYDYSQFDQLKKFELTPLRTEHIQVLGRILTNIHSCAFKWEPPEYTYDAIMHIIDSWSQDPRQDRVRQCIRQIVAELDRTMEDR